MQTQSKVFIGLGLVVLIIVGFSLSKNKEVSTAVTVSDATNVDQMANDEMTDEKEMVDVHPATETDVVMADDNMKKADDGMEMKDRMDDGMEMNDEMSEPEPAPLVAGIYTEYNPEAVSGSQAEHIVLNFSATWCPSCRTLDKNINENISAIPDGVEIYKVDYDTNVELRKKYGITTQHTLVVVDNKGNMIKKWAGGSTLSGLVSKL